MNNYSQLISILKELFQLDQTDLDFGIYRILNAKSDEITNFLENKLKSEVWEVLRQSSWSDQTKLVQEIEDMKTSLQNAWVDPETVPKYQEKQTQLKAGDTFDSLEQDVYSHLTNFFKRYYKDGDFISLRRYKADTYSIPYEWEEVKLYRANHDQYYIKSTENLKNYIFTIDQQKVVFRLVDASTEQNNNKAINNKERRFQLHQEQPYLMEGDTLIIQFSYELHEKQIKQDALNTTTLEYLELNLSEEIKGILFSLYAKDIKKNKKDQRTNIQKHLKDFTDKNSFDYFIHKDLDEFLRRELDFYIKNEVLHIDDIGTTDESKFLSQIGKIKAIKQVAGKLITFLWQLENFQKRLWEKKKFVTNTQYCITLDKIDEKFYPEMLENQAQLDEWKEYYNVEITSIEGMKAEPFLVLDTIYFSVEFRDKILATFDDIDDECDGLLINSENWQALNLLQERYKEQVKCVYIDPPYNTEWDWFIYKDNYRHSSRLSLMKDRLELSNNLISHDNGLFFCHLDENENKRMDKLISMYFPKQKEIIWNKTNDADKTKWKSVKTTKKIHEYILFGQKDTSWEFLKSIRWTWITAWNLKKSQWFNNLEEINQWIAKRWDEFFWIQMPWWKKIPIINISLNEIEFRSSNSEWNKWPIINNNDGSVIYISRRDLEAFENGVLSNPDTTNIPRIDYTWKIHMPSIIGDMDNMQTARDSELEPLVWIESEWTTPKPEKLNDVILWTCEGLVLDYFVWSWSSCAVAHKTDRKYIWIDVITNFRELSIRRMKNVLKGNQLWISKLVWWEWWWMFKYHELESYEDTLNNLNLSKTDSQQALLTANPKLNEEYTLKYMLDIESRESLLSIDDFRHPFDYQLAITKHNETKNTAIDLVETFNYLIWLKVHQQYRAKDIKVVIWSTLDDKRVLVLRRDLDIVSNDMLEGFFKKHTYDIKDDFDFDLIYVNGDTTLENLRTEEEHRKVRMTEEVFLDKMFTGSDNFSL